MQSKFCLCIAQHDAHPQLQASGMAKKRQQLAGNEWNLTAGCESKKQCNREIVDRDSKRENHLLKSLSYQGECTYPLNCSLYQVTSEASPCRGTRLHENKPVKSQTNKQANNSKPRGSRRERINIWN